jgi:predicted metalloprotease with PDZ domain
VEKDPTMTVVGIKAYFKRKHGYHVTGFGARDSSRGVFEGRLVHQIHERLVETKYPKMKSVILGCDLHFDDKIARYVIVGVESHQLAYEQGLRNGDVLLKIDGEEITPGNLFGHFLNIEGEALKKITVFRNQQQIELSVSIFYLNPDAPHLGFFADRDPKTKQFKITKVQEGSSAAREGLLPGDVLLKQNDAVLDNWKSYYRVILSQKENEAQKFLIDRRGQLIEKTIIPTAEKAKNIS